MQMEVRFVYMDHLGWASRSLDLRVMTVLTHDFSFMTVQDTLYVRPQINTYDSCQGTSSPGTYIWHLLIQIVQDSHVFEETAGFIEYTFSRSQDSYHDRLLNVGSIAASSEKVYWEPWVSSEKMINYGVCTDILFKGIITANSAKCSIRSSLPHICEKWVCDSHSLLYRQLTCSSVPIFFDVSHRVMSFLLSADLVIDEKCCT